MEKKLHRNSQEAVLGGVASGLAGYFAIDPAIVRVLFVVSLFFSFGTSILVYVILWAALPDTPYKIDDNAGPPDPPAQQPADGKGRNAKVIGIALVAIGGFLLLDDLMVWFRFHHYFWPLVLIGVGAFLLLKRRDETDSPAAGEPAAGPPVAGPPVHTPPPSGHTPPEAPVQEAPGNPPGSTAGQEDNDDVIKVN